MVWPSTATPALHTVEIFGRPVLVFSYREALDDDALLFKREGGGGPRLNRLCGELEGVLRQFRRDVWAA